MEFEGTTSCCVDNESGSHRRFGIHHSHPQIDTMVLREATVLAPSNIPKTQHALPR